jgi:hypothetical protein
VASVAAIRAALGARCETVGLRQVRGFDKATPPAAFVALNTITFDTTFGRGHDELVFVVRAIVSRADDRAAQDRLDAYLDGSGSSSLKAALETDKTLGGLVDTLHVSGVDNYGVYEVAGIAYVGAEFAVTVHAPGS